MSEFSKIRRPKGGETEDDLLEEMRQFEASKSSIASQNILRIGKNEEKPKQSKFAAGRQQKRQHEGEEQPKSSLHFILKSVVEEKVTEYPDKTGFEPKLKADEPFPAVAKVDVNSLETRGKTQSGKRQSIFAQQMAANMTQQGLLIVILFA